MSITELEIARCITFKLRLGLGSLPTLEEVPVWQKEISLVVFGELGSQSQDR